MAILIFFIILSVLVIVHELGHFLVAKAFGVRTDEFGLGYPPRAKKLFKWKGTIFTLNWLPFGGFVKIYGEDPNEENLHAPGSFQSKNRAIQAAILGAGVVCNFLFAWLLISLGFMSGLPAPAGFLPIENPRTVITMVIPNSPAAEAGLKSGDAIISINGIAVSPEEAVRVIGASTDSLDLVIARGKSTFHEYLMPQEGIVPGQRAIGVSMEVVGTATLSPLRAFVVGAEISWNLLIETAKALGGFISQAIVGKADLSSVTGPVGLVGLVGDATKLGLGYILSFTAIISINLSLVNLLPFPALDGGRLLFVLIESVSRRRIPAKLYSAANLTGFALLILLMILITIHDVRVIL